MVQLYFDSIFGYLLFVGHIVIWMMILAGNTLTIVTVCKCRNLQSKTNILVASLSCADMFVGIFSIIYDSCRIFNLTDVSNPKHGFILLFQLQNASFVCSLVHLVAIATDRYICILHSLRYEHFMSDLRFRILTGCLWVILYSFSIIPAPLAMLGMFGIRRLTPLFLPLHLIGAAVICFIYICIYRASRKQAFLIDQQIASVSESVQKDMKKKRKSAKILGLLVLAYIITWVPTIAFSAIVWSTNSVGLGTAIGFEICNMFILSNSAINVYIYAWKNSKFREGYIQILKCHSSNSVHPAAP